MTVHSEGVRALVFERSGCPEGWCCRKELRHNDDTNPHLVPADLEYLATAAAAMAKREGPRVGDFVRYADGTMTRIAYLWTVETLGSAKVQTCPGGSFHLCKSGGVSMSGGLDSAIPWESLTDTGEQQLGSVWWFHLGRGGAGRGVNGRTLFRVFATSVESRRP